MTLHSNFDTRPSTSLGPSRPLVSLSPTSIMTVDSSSPPSMLPSPPTSPVSPRAATTRIRITPKRASLGNLPDRHGHTRAMSSLSRIVTDAVSPTSPPMEKSKRRQSSITYYTPSSPSPWSHRHRKLPSSVDGPRDEPVSVNGKENVSQRSSLVLTSRSSSTRESLSSADAITRERELTLVEKYADLLHFIAQKERKCLELRDQLAAHEEELAELKRKWERIVNGGQDPHNASPAGLGGVALDGLKEGVRMIAAGLSDFSGVIHDLDASDDHVQPTLSREPSRTHRRSHLSTSTVAFPTDEGVAAAAAPVSLSRASSLNRRHAPPRIDPSPPTAPLDACFVRTPSPTLVPTSTWMDTVGRKLSGLHKGPTFAKSQTRASSFLAGVSTTITLALSPGPTATTPAPLPLAKAQARAPRSCARVPSEPHPHPMYAVMSDWLEDDDGEVHAASLPPALLSPPLSSAPDLQPLAQTQRDVRTEAVSSFDDDTWNW